MIGVRDEPPSQTTVRVAEDHIDFFTRRQVVVVYERTWFGEHGRLHTRGWWVPIAREMLEDLGERTLGSIFHELADRGLSPWRYPDREAFPARMDLFPVSAQLWRRLVGDARYLRARVELWRAR